ncbi:MAG: hypothetical protein AAGA65_19255 [Actinomycetota bacterium]
MPSRRELTFSAMWSSLVGKGLTSVLQLVALPIARHALDDRAFVSYAVVVSLSAWLSFASPAMGPGAIVAAARSSTSVDRIPVHVPMSLVVLALPIPGLVMLVAAANGWLGLGGELADSPLALFMLALAALVSALATSNEGLLIGRLQPVTANALNALGTVLALGVLAILIAWDSSSWPALFSAVAILPRLPHALLLLVGTHRLLRSGDQHALFSHPGRRRLRQSVRETGLTNWRHSVVQIGSMATLNLPVLVAASRSTPDATALLFVLMALIAPAIGIVTPIARLQTAFGAGDQRARVGLRQLGPRRAGFVVGGLLLLVSAIGVTLPTLLDNVYKIADVDFAVSFAFAALLAAVAIEYLTYSYRVVAISTPDVIRTALLKVGASAVVLMTWGSLAFAGIFALFTGAHACSAWLFERTGSSNSSATGEVPEAPLVSAGPTPQGGV